MSAWSLAWSSFRKTLRFLSCFGDISFSVEAENYVEAVATGSGTQQIILALSPDVLAAVSCPLLVWGLDTNTGVGAV